MRCGYGPESRVVEVPSLKITDTCGVGGTFIFISKAVYGIMQTLLTRSLSMNRADYGHLQSGWMQRHFCSPSVGQRWGLRSAAPMRDEWQPWNSVRVSKERAQDSVDVGITYHSS